MPVKKSKDGHRFIQAEVEVPGSPEEVWRAIATGSGISSWFVPTTSDERIGGTTVSSFGPGMDSTGTIKEWNPPHSVLVETEGGPGAIATEWIVEARAGGTCTVRVIHRWFADSDDWDGEFEAHAYGWAATFFRMLRLYLTHFAGQRCSTVDLAAFSTRPGPDTWRNITSGLDIDAATRQVNSIGDSPALSGTSVDLEVTDPDLLEARSKSPLIAAALEGMDGEMPELLVRLDRPAPGLAHFSIMPMGEQTMVSIRFFLYGDQGAAAAEGVRQQWNAWLAERFPEGGA